MTLPDGAKELIRAGALGHLVTNSPNGAVHVTCVWVAVEGDELLTAHLNPRQRKLENVRRDPHANESSPQAVAASLDTDLLGSVRREAV